jgi:predicted nuclease with RNAse H fold
VGIDVGAKRLHVVVLDDRARVVESRSVPTDDVAAIAAWAAPAGAIAVDSPDRWSRGPHPTENGARTLPAKFAAARCGEVALARAHGIWVPWVAPTAAEGAPAWMQVGVALFQALRDGGHCPVEVYPHGVFLVLAGGRRPPSKRTPAGRAVRAALLQKAGVRGVDGLTSTHDLLDAAAAGLVALHRRRGLAVGAGCGHDGTSIWLPAGVPEASRPPLRR